MRLTMTMPARAFQFRDDYRQPRVERKTGMYVHGSSYVYTGDHAPTSAREWQAVGAAPAHVL